MEPVPDNRVGLVYESYIAVLAQARGYAVKATPVSHDYGGDLLLFNPAWPQREHPSLVVQCKWDSWSNIGLAAVQEVHAAKTYYKATTACVVSNQQFTYEARELADTVQVELYTVTLPQWQGRGWAELPAVTPLQVKSADVAASRACQRIIDTHVKHSPSPEDKWACDATSIRLDYICVPWDPNALCYAVEGTLEHRWKGWLLRHYERWTWSCRVWPYTGVIMTVSALAPVDVGGGTRPDRGVVTDLLPRNHDSYR